MKKLYKKISYILSFTLLLITLASCVNSSYNWGNLDKNGELSIPAVPLGTLDSIYLKGLPVIPELPEGQIPIEGKELALTHTLRKLFSRKDSKNFFYDGAKDAEIYALIDVHTVINDLEITIYSYVLDQHGVKIKDVEIPQQVIRNGDSQDIHICIAERYMKYMVNAYHLKFVFVLRGESINLHKDDLVVMREAILKPGGLHVEL